MTEHLTDVDQLPNVKLTPEQDERAVAMGKAMTREYLGNYSAARVIVHQQDQIAKLESDLAWIRRRTGFWGEVPQSTPAHERESPHCPTCACGMPSETTGEGA